VHFAYRQFGSWCDMLSTVGAGNFVRKHMTLKTTLARAIGIAKRTWTIRDMVELLPAACHSEKF
jgi:hypothetical protein